MDGVFYSTLWSNNLLENLVVAYKVDRPPEFYLTRKYITDTGFHPEQDEPNPHTLTQMLSDRP